MLSRGRPKGRVVATILFTDVAGSTELVARLGDEAWRALLDRYRSAVRRELRRFGGSEVDAAGDGFFALFDTPAAALRCAVAIRAAAQDLGVRVRSGVHTAEVEVADGRTSGIGVHIASRIQALAEPDGIMASSTTRDLAAGSAFVFTDAGVRELRGVPGSWHLYTAAAVAAQPSGPDEIAGHRRRVGTPAIRPARNLTVGLAGAAVVAVMVVAAILSGARLTPVGASPAGATARTADTAAASLGPGSQATGSTASGGAAAASPAAASPAGATPSGPAPSASDAATASIGPPGPSAGAGRPAPALLSDGVHPPGLYLLGAVAGRPTLILADPWQAYVGDNNVTIWLADRPGNRIVFAAAGALPTDACGSGSATLPAGDPAAETIAWLRANPGLRVGRSVVRGSDANASTQLDVEAVAGKSCAGDPERITIVTTFVAAPGINVTAGAPVRLLVHALPKKVFIAAVQAPTPQEFEQFLPQADAVLSSLDFATP